MRHLTLRSDVEREVALEGSGDAWHMRMGDDVLAARLCGLRDSGGWLDVGGRVVPFRCWRDRDVVHVWLDGRVWRFEAGAAAKARARGAAGAGGDHVSAPMPGTIRKVEVTPGDEVAERQAVIIMESMKMEMTLTAPRAGAVSEVRCKVGDLVELGAVLVTLADA